MFLFLPSFLISDLSIVITYILHFSTFKLLREPFCPLFKYDIKKLLTFANFRKDPVQS